MFSILLLPMLFHSLFTKAFIYKSSFNCNLKYNKKNLFLFQSLSSQTLSSQTLSSATPEFSASATSATPPRLQTPSHLQSQLEDKYNTIEYSTNNNKKSSKKNKNDDVKLKTIFPEYKPRGPNQELYFKSLQDPSTDIVLGVGPAGSGKTMFACYIAVQELIKGNIKKIIMTRPLVSVDKEDIGFLPGKLENKMDPWTRPIFDILLEFFSQREIDSMIKSGTIEISPLAYMRGRTFKNAFIIADEMQNSSPNQMLMMTTRIGEGTKMVITGDLKQSDRNDENGLLDFIQKIKMNNNHEKDEKNNIQLVELDASDIERSPVVKKILKLYETLSSTLPHLQTEDKTFTPPKTVIHPKNDCAMIPKEIYKKQ